jgi:hypothetical protein
MARHPRCTHVGRFPVIQPKLLPVLHAAFVALVITAIIGGLGLALEQPLLFPSLGPTIFIHTVAADQSAARPWNTFAGHTIGAAVAFAALAIFGGLHAPAATVSGGIHWPRIAASALAVAFTILLQIPLRAGHAPAAATTLLITLGGLKADLATVAILIVGVTLASVLCDWGRRVTAREFHSE